MLRHEDWVQENIDYEFLDEEDLKATSLLTAANSSQFLKSLPLEAPQVPLRTLFAELQDVRLVLAELGADSALVTILLDLPEIGVRQRCEAFFDGYTQHLCRPVRPFLDEMSL
ncbi:MAG: hypothetical protein JNK57_17245 [Planctomycetaceae bacterium]|nr:hypothetical protein [Planctomycetaceae bacterium]